METVVLFLFKSVLLSGLLLSWYWLGLRNKRLHQYNRFFLLFILFASLSVPLLHFQLFTIKPAVNETITPAGYLLQVMNNQTSEEPHISRQIIQAGTNWRQIIFISCIFISLALLALLVLRIIWVFSMSKKFPVTRKDGIILIQTNLARAPFSFLHFLFWRDTIPLETSNGQLIYQHEITHIKQKHTYDKLACQAICCIFWMNPFYWLIQKELAMIHEFIADEQAIKTNDTVAFARMLLQTNNQGNYLIPEHQFFSSPIKRRLLMLQTTTTTTYTLLRKFAVLPLLAGTILIFSFTNQTQKTVRADKNIVLVLDPGHGGKDYGATEGDLKESDLVLKIADHIRLISPEYNVTIMLTRDKDEYITLDNRVAYSNSIHPDYFISIHTDATVSNKPVNAAPFEVEIIEPSAHFQHPEALKLKTHNLAKCIFANTLFLRGSSGTNMQDTTKPLQVLRNNQAPAIALQLGNLRNKSQMDKINDEKQLDDICRAILKGVVEASKS